MRTSMIDELVNKAEHLAQNPPPNEKEAIQKYATEVRDTRNKLDMALSSPGASVGDPRFIAAAQFMDTLEQMEQNASLLLQSVLDEEPQIENDEGGYLDVPASVETLARRVAAEVPFKTIGDKLLYAQQEFDRELAPLLPVSDTMDPEIADIPRQIFAERVKELFSLPPDKLAVELDKHLPPGINEENPPAPPKEPSRQDKGNKGDTEYQDHGPAETGTPSDGKGYPKSNTSTRDIWDKHMDKTNPQKPTAPKISEKTAAKEPVINQIKINQAPAELGQYGIPPELVVGTVQDVSSIEKQAGVTYYYVEHDGMEFGFREDQVEPVKTAAEDDDDDEKKEEDDKDEDKSEKKESAYDRYLRRKRAEEKKDDDEEEKEDDEDDDKKEASRRQAAPWNRTPQEDDRPIHNWKGDKSGAGYDPPVREGLPESSSGSGGGKFSVGTPVVISDVDEMSDWHDEVAYGETFDAEPTSDLVGQRGTVALVTSHEELWGQSAQSLYGVDAEEEELTEEIYGVEVNGTVYPFLEHELDTTKGQIRARRRRRAVKDNSGVDAVQDPTKNPPYGGRPFQEYFEEEGQKNRGAPRGPNRRRGDDVPASSSDKKKLTSKLVDSVYQELRKEGIFVRRQDVPAMIRQAWAEEERREKQSANSPAEGFRPPDWQPASALDSAPTFREGESVILEYEDESGVANLQGVITHDYGDGQMYEVEFTTPDGETISSEMGAEQLRKTSRRRRRGGQGKVAAHFQVGDRVEVPLDDGSGEIDSAEIVEVGGPGEDEQGYSDDVIYTLLVGEGSQFGSYRWTIAEGQLLEDIGAQSSDVTNPQDARVRRPGQWRTKNRNAQRVNSSRNRTRRTAMLDGDATGESVVVESVDMYGYNGRYAPDPPFVGYGHPEADMQGLTGTVVGSEYIDMTEGGLLEVGEGEPEGEWLHAVDLEDGRKAEFMDFELARRGPGEDRSTNPNRRGRPNDFSRAYANRR